MEIIGGKLVYEVLSAKQFSYRTASLPTSFRIIFPLNPMDCVVEWIREK